MSGPLTAALRPLGLKPLSWQHLRTHHRPGAGISALYQVEAVPRRGSAGSAGSGRAESSVQLQVGATTAALTAEQGRRTVRGTVDGTGLRLWVHPRDPVLTGLAWATNPGAVARGLFGAETEEARAALTLAAYRPLRRAVVRSTFEGSTAYLKVLHPGAAQGLRRRLEAAAAAGLPVPALLDPALGAGAGAGAGAGVGAETDGVLALGALPGRSLHQQMHSAQAGVEPQQLLDLLAGLPAAALAFPRKPAWADRVVDYAAGASVAFPKEAERIARCARETDAAVRATDPGPVVPVHGDFHGGNLLVDAARGGQEISGLLDVDALGPGHRVDDLACFVGHLFVFAAVNHTRPDLQASAERFAAAFAAEAQPGALYSRAAAVALTLVAGAAGRGHAAAEQALAAAEGLLERARNPS